MEEPILSLKEVKKAYHHGKVRVDALRGVSIDVMQGEIVSVFGRSGSGKTTLLNIIGGIDRPDSGEVVVDGRRLREVSSGDMPGFRRKNIGFVFQTFNLIPYLTAMENTALPLKFDGVDKEERSRRALSILEELGIKDRAGFFSVNLSGGQIQRTAFARAVINNPRIVLADEPTGQLDTATAKELADTIVQLNHSKNLTFILATHDRELSRISHRIIYLKDGGVDSVETVNSCR